MSLDLTPSDAELQLFQQLNQIPLTTFWTTNRLCLTMQQFIELLPNIQFLVTPQQLHALKEQNVQFVNLSAVVEGVQYWRAQQGSVSAFLTKQEQMNQSRQKQHKQSKADTGRSKYDFNLRTNTSRASNAAKSRAISRQLEAEIKLTQTLIQAKNQSNYELTIKVGETNDLCKKLKNNFSYLIDTSEGDAKILEMNGKTGEQTQIKEKNFDKKYAQFKEASLQKGQEYEGTLEQDLKKTLVEVMCLSDQLQEQIRLLQAKGVTH